MLRELAAAIIRNGKVSSGWEQSFNVCLYKAKAGALERGNYCGLKLTAGQESPGEDCGRPQTVGVNRQFPCDSQFGFVPGRGITKAQSLLSDICKRSI